MKSQRQIRNTNYIKSLINNRKNKENAINSNYGAGGRFANHFFRDIACSLIATKSNINYTYGKYRHMIEELGISLFKPEKETIFETNIQLDDDNFFQYIYVPIENNFSLKGSYCQTKDFANYIYNYIRNSDIKKSVIEKNKYKHRYNNNNDIFIHIRLGDVLDKQKETYTFEYFDNILKSLQFDKGYLASDSLNDELCTKLIEKYNLISYDNNEIDTIMFGSTCRNVILTSGTFSWVIGVFSYNSTVFYKLCKDNWCSQEIFSIDDWKRIL